MSRQATKRSKVIPGSGGSAEDDTLEGLTKRLLLSMVFDVSQLAENVEHIKVKVFTMAKAHGIVPPSDD